jgi:hypothetical protein
MPAPPSPLHHPSSPAQLFLLVAGLLLSLVVASFMTLRVCRLRSSMPGSASADSKSCYSRAATTITLNLLALLCYGSAAVLLWFAINPLSNWYMVNLGTLRDPWNRYLVWGDNFNCVVPLTVGMGAGFFSVCIAIACAGCGMALDFFSHCCCKSSNSDGCLTNPNYWWVLPNPATMAPSVQVELPAALRGSGKAVWGSGGTPRAAEEAAGAGAAAAASSAAAAEVAAAAE